MVSRKVRLLGLNFADMDAVEAAGLLTARPASQRFGYVVTPNADHLVRLHRRPELKSLYAGALLCLLDSRVVGRAARLVGLRAPRVAPGSDLTAVLMRRLHPDESITIVGLRAGRLAGLMARHGLRAVAHLDPPPGFERDPEAMREAVAFVLAHSARFVFLAVGSPRQEMLAAAIAATGRATGVGLCIGASLDFLSGAMPRAPVWLQRVGLEWLHRLVHDPVRLARRYLFDCPAVFPLLWREAVRHTKSRRSKTWMARLRGP